MFSFQQRINFAMISNSQDYVVAFYNDFSKAFDRVPNFELIKKIAGMRVGGFMLEILSDYWRTDLKLYALYKLFHQKESHKWSSAVFCFWPAPVFYVHNDLPEALNFNEPSIRFFEPSIFADDLIILAVKRTQHEIQTDVTAFDKWATENKM